MSAEHYYNKARVAAGFVIGIVVAEAVFTIAGCIEVKTPEPKCVCECSCVDPTPGPIIELMPQSMPSQR